MKVQINGTGYEMRYGLRSLFTYEKLNGRPYEGETLEEMYRLFHATLLACNADCILTFDELVDACDADPTLFEKFAQMIQDAMKRAALFKKKAVDEKR